MEHGDTTAILAKEKGDRLVQASFFAVFKSMQLSLPLSLIAIPHEASPTSNIHQPLVVENNALNIFRTSKVSLIVTIWRRVAKVTMLFINGKLHLVALGHFSGVQKNTHIFKHSSVSIFQKAKKFPSLLEKTSPIKASQPSSNIRKLILSNSTTLDITEPRTFLLKSYAIKLEMAEKSLRKKWKLKHSSIPP